MLFQLAKKNIKGNFKNYFLYFISVVFNVTIYFAFQNMANNEQIKGLLEQDVKFLILFKCSAIIIAIFTAIFIWYSSSFFIKKRKKELGLYSLLGLKKKEIGRLLFYENMIIGSFALIVGVLIGGIFSKLFMMILLNFMGMNLHITFSIVGGAVLYTAITFGILFLIISINSYSIIYRFELIDLFKAESKSENKNKNNKKTKPSIILSLFAIILLVIEGVAVINIKDSATFLTNIPIAFVASIIGTFIFFSAFLTFATNCLKNNKKLYYRGDNLISISHFLYRIKSNAKTLAIIAITNAVALTAISVTYSLDYNMKEIKKFTYPYSYAYVTTGESLDLKVEEAIEKHPENKLIKSAEVEFIKVSGKVDDFSDLNFENTYLISVSKYKHMLELKGLNSDFKMPSNSQALLLQYGPTSLDDIKGKIVNIDYKNSKNTFEIIDRKMEEPLNPMDIGPILLVQDEIYSQYVDKDNIVKLKAYSIENELDSTGLSKDLIKIMPDGVNLSYAQELKGTLVFSAMMLFVGILTGIVFLSSTGSILYFKQITEATDDQPRYSILKKIGVSKKQVKKSIQKQVIIIFALPIGIGVFHNLLALRFLSSIVDLSINVPVAISIVVYILIYLIYYLITVKTYTKIVTEN
ncbi:ABC transporter permease [Clostridium sp. CTA-5]